MAQAMIIDGQAVLKSDSAKNAGTVQGLILAKRGNTLATIKCSFPERADKIVLADLERYYAKNQIHEDDSGVILRDYKGRDMLLEIQDAKAYQLPNQMMFIYPTFEKPMDIQVGDEITQRGVMTFAKIPEANVDIITADPESKPKDLDTKINAFLERKFDKKFDKAGRIIGVGVVGAEYGLLKILEASSAVGDVFETTKKTVKSIRAEKKAGTYEKESFFKRWKKQFVSDKEKGELIFQQTRDGIGESRKTSQIFVERMKRMIRGH